MPNPPRSARENRRTVTDAGRDTRPGDLNQALPGTDPAPIVTRDPRSTAFAAALFEELPPTGKDDEMAQEADLVPLAEAYPAATDFHRKRPVRQT